MTFQIVFRLFGRLTGPIMTLPPTPLPSLASPSYRAHKPPCSPQISRSSLDKTFFSSLCSHSLPDLRTPFFSHILSLDNSYPAELSLGTSSSRKPLWYPPRRHRGPSQVPPQILCQIFSLPLSQAQVPTDSPVPCITCLWVPWGKKYCCDQPMPGHCRCLISIFIELTKV